MYVLKKQIVNQQTKDSDDIKAVPLLLYNADNGWITSQVGYNSI